MQLKHKVVTRIEVEDGDLESFAKPIYGLKDYCFAEVQECGNDSSHTFRVTGKLDDWDLKKANEVMVTKTINSNYLLLDMLCRDGHILPGEYLIKVCW